jgi:hypothetical protein
LHGPGADDDPLYLPGDGGNRGQSGWGPARHLDQPQPAVERPARISHSPATSAFLNTGVLTVCVTHRYG